MTGKPFRGYRRLRTELIAIVGTLCGASVVAALASVVLLLVARGPTDWAKVVFAGAEIAASALLIVGLWRTRQADGRLAACPTPSASYPAIIGVRPRLGAAFAFWVVVLMGLAIYVGFLAVDTASKAASASSRVEQGDSPIAAVAGGLILIGLVLMFIGALSWVVLWVFGNRNQDLLWLSAEGLGYLPDREGDKGFLLWEEVTELRYSSTTWRGFTTQHTWDISALAQPQVRVAMLPSVTPRAEAVFAVAREVAPEVTRGTPGVG